MIDHCSKVVKTSTAIRYVVITRRDGFSLVTAKSGWSQQNLEGALWRPAEDGAADGRLLSSDLAKEDVFHFSSRFRYSGLDWGWIHIGLSLQTYRADMRRMQQRTWALILLCAILNSALSLLFARRLARPVRLLRGLAGQVAAGDLSAGWRW